MAEQQVVTPESVTQDMHELLRSMHENGYSNVDELGRFIVLYEQRSDTLDPDDPNARTAFLESLDVPDIDLEFHEGIFDEIAVAYYDLGGDRTKLQFPDVDRQVTTNWTEELNELSQIFSDAYREGVGPLHPNVGHAHTIAEYIREHNEELRTAGSADQYTQLITNPNFILAYAKVCSFDEDDRPNSKADFDRKYEEGVFLETVLEAVGYQTATSYHHDWAYLADVHRKPNIAPNLRTIALLEKERPGATRLLSDHYGIRHFTRYPVALLAEQFDTHGEADRPYGVIMSAVSDHNGAFSNAAPLSGRTTPEQLYEQTQGKYGLRVCEAESKKEFKERLAMLDALYGDKEKISFAVIQAHGRYDSVHLGGWTNAGSIALTAKLKGVRSAFAPNASISLDSCSTGQINGVAQAISRRLGVTVVAPVEATAVKGINLVTDKKSVRLVPDYGQSKRFFGDEEQETEAAVYQNGKPLGKKATAAYLSVET